MGRWQKWLSWAAALSGLALAAPVSQAAAVAGWVASGGTTAQVGSMVRLQFAYNGLSTDVGSSLALFDMDVTYSASSLRFMGGSFEVAGPGSNALALAEAGASPFLGDFIDDSAGRLDVFGFSGNSQAVLDTLQANDLVLFELVFEALAVDAGAFVGVDLGDPFLLFGSSDTSVTLAFQFNPAQINLNIGAPGGTPVPEPSTLLLAALAGLNLCAFRGRPRARSFRSPSCA